MTGESRGSAGRCSEPTCFDHRPLQDGLHSSFSGDIGIDETKLDLPQRRSFDMWPRTDRGDEFRRSCRPVEREGGPQRMALEETWRGVPLLCRRRLDVSAHVAIRQCLQPLEGLGTFSSGWRKAKDTSSS